MKVMSLNVRGLWDRTKRSRIRFLVSLGQLDLCLLQESKCSLVDDSLMFNL